MAASAASPPSTTVQRDQLWADKYRPRTVSEMCYPHMALQLREWLRAFPAPQSPTAKRACLLSGPPGVGKTTTVHLVAQELGYTVVEFNASDHRSAKSLAESVSDVVDNRSISGLGFGRPATTNASSAATSAAALVDPTKIKLTKFVLLMDEVDGCDRGGVAEVINMIKRTKVPILCTCNDRWHQKLRSLLGYVEDMKFSRPPFNVVAAYIRDRVLAKEGCVVPFGLLQDVIKMEGNDIRSTLNNLQLWCRANKNLSEYELAKAARAGHKNADVSMFNAAEVFLMQGSSSDPRPPIGEQLSLFYSADLIDLFVQENYVHFLPSSGEDWMRATARSAESISRADIVKRMVFTEQNWSVSNMHVLTSTIAPCVFNRGKYQTFLSGPAAGFDKSRPVKFPIALGHNSTVTKNTRLSTCLAKQGRHPTHGFSANADEVVMDYASVLAGVVTQPLAANGKDGIPEVMGTMDNYKMIRDDWDFVQEITRFKKQQCPGHQQRITAAVPTAAKSAFTKAFNAAHKGDRLTLRSKLGVVPEAREDEVEEGSDADGDDDNEGGDAPLKRGRTEAGGAEAPARRAAGKKTATAPAGGAKPKAPPKPRAKKAPAAAAAAAGSGASDPIEL